MTQIHFNAQAAAVCGRGIAVTAAAGFREMEAVAAEGVENNAEENAFYL